MSGMSFAMVPRSLVFIAVLLWALVVRAQDTQLCTADGYIASKSGAVVGKGSLS